jgi:CHAT domain-containing protein
MVVEIEPTNKLVQQILSTSDIKDFVSSNLPFFSLDDVIYLKSMVDQIATMDFNQASRLAEAVWEIGYSLGDDFSKSCAEAALGRVEYCYGHYSQSLAHYEKAIHLLKNLNNPVEVAILQKQLVGVLMYLGKHKEAISLASKACRVLKRNGEQSQLAELETNIGNLHCYLLDNYHKSLRYYKRAQKIFVKLKNEKSLARLQHNIANALTNLDRIDEALELYQRASKIYYSYGMSVYAGQADYNIAYLLFRRGQYQEALKYYYNIKESQKLLGDEVSVAWCNLDMAEIYLQLRVFEESNLLALAAKTSFLEFENSFKAAWAQVLVALANAGLGRLQEARKELYDVLENFSRQNNQVVVGLIHTYLSDVELKIGNYQTALVNAQEAERIFVISKLPVKTAFARFALAKIFYLIGKLADIETLLASVKEIGEKYNIHELKYGYHYLNGCILEKAQKPQQAMQSFSYAIDIVNNIRSHLYVDELKSSFLQDKLELFENMVGLCIDSSKYLEALQYIEQAKVINLGNLLAYYLDREIPVKLANPQLQKTFINLLNELNWYSSHSAVVQDESESKSYDDSYQINKRQNCEKELTEIFRRIQIENIEYAELTQHNILDIKALQKTIKIDEIIIEYFFIKEQVFAFVITSKQTYVYKNLLQESEIESILRGFHFQIKKFSLNQTYIERYFSQLCESIKQYLVLLFDKLVRPILTDNLTAKTLTIIPHGLLHYIPFHALHNKLNYLIEDYDISYAPSLTVYSLCLQKTTINTGSMLVLGLTDELTPEISSEVAMLKEVYSDTIALINEDATLINLRTHSANCRILHLASHCVVRPDNPLFSYLKLSDGELSFYNTFDLNLQAELVTLSACHTGINKVFPGDDLHGLMRGFLYAGTPAMIVSLWQVNDKASREFMSYFYKEFLTGKSKREALCQAQRKMLLKWKHPYYWAAFILIGKP